MLSKILLIPFLIATFLFLYLAWEVSSDYAIYLVVSLSGAVCIYLLSPQINWWWYKRYPPQMPVKLRHLLHTQHPFYQSLHEPEKTRFRQRAMLYMEANEFKGQAMQSVPADVKLAIAASVVHLTFELEDYLLSKFEHIIVYPHPFPSPQYPETWHTCEHFEEDGVIMFSAEQLMAGFLRPAQYFHIGLYEYAMVFRRCHPGAVFPELTETAWPQLERISGFSKDLISKWVGLPDIDITAVAVAHFFVFPQNFQSVLPEVYAGFARVFMPGPEPIIIENPS